MRFRVLYRQWRNREKCLELNSKGRSTTYTITAREKGKGQMKWGNLGQSLLEPRVAEARDGMGQRGKGREEEAMHALWLCFMQLRLVVMRGTWLLELIK
jgi:hypothetical protein